MIPSQRTQGHVLPPPPSIHTPAGLTLASIVLRLSKVSKVEVQQIYLDRNSTLTNISLSGLEAMNLGGIRKLRTYIYPIFMT